ncbi:protein NETWORKED 4B-like [Euphorbia lathyris]|uniref:protein NETWORKED 4B-like n=1 Tax=Euphorbia lathyris TaxID=212925 RepID=UPI003313EC2F
MEQVVSFRVTSRELQRNIQSQGSSASVSVSDSSSAPNYAVLLGHGGNHTLKTKVTEVSDAAEKIIFPQKAQIRARILKILDERSILQEQVRELESQNQFLKNENRVLQIEKSEKEERHSFQINQLKEEIVGLNKSNDGLKLKIDEMNGLVISLNKMNKHMQQLHMERVQLISGAKEALKLVGKLRSKAKELEEEVERQRVVIEEGAEEKREAIRQLCFSIEHYRDGYHRLQGAFIEHNRV